MIYEIGDRIFCPKYGYGYIESIDEDEVEYYDEDSDETTVDDDYRSYHVRFVEENSNLSNNVDDDLYDCMWFYEYETRIYQFELADEYHGKERPKYYNIIRKIKQLDERFERRQVEKELLNVG